MDFEIVFKDNGKGLSVDAALLTEQLSALGHVVAPRAPSRLRPPLIGDWSHSRKARRLGVARLPEMTVRAVGTALRLAPGGPSPIRIHLEAVSAGDLLSRSLNVLIPNPEWLSWHDEWALPLMDLIACKTRCAEQRFAAEGFPTFFLGFTSRGWFRAMPSGSLSRRTLHVASDGSQKGTSELLSVWRRHPEWPELVVLAGRARGRIEGASNICIVSDWVSDDELAELMRSCPIHVCCSNAEGFGHTILESMGCGALVLSTDLAPMNELVSNERGLLVPPGAVEPMNWGRKAVLDPEALEAGIETALSMSDEEILSRGRNARAWYLQNDRDFRERVASFVALVAELER